MSSSRVEKFRNKLKLLENADLLFKYKEKNRINYQAYRDKKHKNKESALIFRKRRAKQRKSQRDQRARIKQVFLTGSEELFKSKSSLGKAVKRVENVLHKTKLKLKKQ